MFQTVWYLYLKFPGVVDDVYMTFVRSMHPTWKCVCVFCVYISKYRRTTFDSMPLRNDFRVLTQVTSKDGLTSGYINIILPQMAETYLFFRGFCSSSQGMWSQIIPISCLVSSGSFVLCFSIFGASTFLNRDDPSLFELQGSDEVAFKRYGNQDVPLVTSSPWSSTVRPLKNGWLGRHPNHSANPTLRRCSTHQRSSGFHPLFQQQWLSFKGILTTRPLAGDWCRYISPLIRHENLSSTT